MGGSRWGKPGSTGGPAPLAPPYLLSQKQSPQRKTSSPQPLASLSGPGSQSPPVTQGAQKLLGSEVVLRGLIKVQAPGPRAGAGQMPVTTPKPASPPTEKGLSPGPGPSKGPRSRSFLAWKDASGGPAGSFHCSTHDSVNAPPPLPSPGAAVPRALLEHTDLGCGGPRLLDPACDEAGPSTQPI